MQCHSDSAPSASQGTELQVAQVSTLYSAWASVGCPEAASAHPVQPSRHMYDTSREVRGGLCEQCPWSRSIIQFLLCASASASLNQSHLNESGHVGFLRDAGCIFLPEDQGKHAPSDKHGWPLVGSTWYHLTASKSHRRFLTSRKAEPLRTLINRIAEPAWDKLPSMQCPAGSAPFASQATELRVAQFS